MSSKQQITSTQHRELIKTVSHIAHELEHIAESLNHVVQTLLHYDVEMTGDEINRMVEEWVNKQNATLVFTDFEARVKEGLPEQMMGTYDTKEKAIATNTSVDDTTRRCLNRLLELDRVMYPNKDEGKHKRYMVELMVSKEQDDVIPAESPIIFRREKSDDDILQIGPRQKIRMKLGEDALDTLLNSIGYTRETLTDMVNTVRDQLEDDDVVFARLASDDVIADSVH